MSKDIHLGFGTEGVQFTDHPVPERAPDSLMGAREYFPVTGLTRRVDHAEGFLTKEQLESIQIKVINLKPFSDEQLDYIAKTFGLERVSATKAEESQAMGTLQEEKSKLAAAIARRIAHEAIDNNEEPDFSKLFLPVRGGAYVRFGDRIWWRTDNGPERIWATHQNGAWTNIAKHPELHQHSEPEFNHTTCRYED